jgi:cysteine desulfurase/selenocysteine lyase
MSADGGAVQGPSRALDVEAVRDDFPILGSTVRGKPLVYLDNAATTQKPRAVVEAVNRFYTRECSNVHRGVHRLSELATASFEGARDAVRRFIGAADRSEIVFTSGATAAINLVAHSFGAANVGRDDEILITHLEHHANIVPWQLLCERSGARLRVIPVDDDGRPVLDHLDRLIGDRTRIVCATHTSNALGTHVPLGTIIAEAHRRGVPVLVDGAQAMAHAAVDVRALDCDFFAFSSHKMFGPTGIGVLYGKRELLERMPPFLGGGEMIMSVSHEGTTYKEPPYRFEAGTPDIAGAAGLGAAVGYLESLGLDRIAAHEGELLRYALARLGGVPRLSLLGASPDGGSIVSFTVDGVHPHDLGTALDFEGVAVRAGHHCAQPLMERFGVSATVRASFACYNTRREVDVLVAALGRAIELLG